MVQVPLFAVDGDRIVRCVGYAVGFVVTGDEVSFTMQELHHDMGKTRVAVIEHADMPGPCHGLENGCEGVHGNQGCRSAGFSPPIELTRDAIVIRLEYLSNARELVTFGQADISRHGRPLAHAEDGRFRPWRSVAVDDKSGIVLPNDNVLRQELCCSVGQHVSVH